MKTINPSETECLDLMSHLLCGLQEHFCLEEKKEDQHLKTKFTENGCETYVLYHGLFYKISISVDDF